MRAALITLALFAVAAAPARADDTVLVSGLDAAAVTAYGSQVVYSQRDALGQPWKLMRWHDGVADALPVPPRAVPFDADAGPDASGQPVVVYSRCRTEPDPSGLSPAPDWQTARGCDLYELPLTGGGGERRLAASSRGMSETTPSIWHGALAYARHADGGARATIEYLPAGASRPRALGGGSVQACFGMCDGARRLDGVLQLDLGPSRVAYVWQMTGGAVYGTGVSWELRAAALAGGPSTLLETGIVSGTCGYSVPGSPVVSAAREIAYLHTGDACDEASDQTAGTKASFALADPVIGALATAPTPGLARAAARDGDTIYWLRQGNGVDLVASSLPAYAPQPRQRVNPQADIDLARSGLGYRWVAGPAGTRLLRPPARIPCAPSGRAAVVYTAAQWSHGRHVVRVQRVDPRRPPRRVGITLTRSGSTGGYSETQLTRCGQRTRLIYTVTTYRSTHRVSFTVTRASLRP